MIRSFLTITLRILWRNKVTSFVNVFGLSIGITAFIFIMLYVQHETSYDKFNQHYNYIYRVEGDTYVRLPPVVGTYVKDRIPEAKTVTRWTTLDDVDITFKAEDTGANVKHARINIAFADSTTFDVFTFSFLQGDSKLALRNPFTCVISESVARNLFGDINPMGKSIDLLDHEFEVTGVIKDVQKSHIEAKVLLSFHTIPKLYPDRDVNNSGRNSWLWSATYLLMADKIDEAFVEEKINTVLAEINDGHFFDTKFKAFRLRPLKKIYFDGALENLDYGSHGSFKLISILSVIGIFMLLLACINYVNLTTARSSVRTKEVAVKRIVGSSVTTVRVQFILESVILSFVSLAVSLTAVQIFISKFNEVARINVQLSELNRPEIWVMTIGGGILLGMIAGIYPALYLTSAKPVRMVTGGVTRNDESVFSRSLLMTFQFTLSIILIVCAIANLKQLDYVRNANLGFQTRMVIQVQTPTDLPNEGAMRETFKKDLLRFSDIQSIAFSAGGPGGFIPRHPIEFGGKKHYLEFFLVDHDYLEVMDIQVAQGKSFAEQIFRSDFVSKPDNISILINEAAVHELGLKDPVGQFFYWEDQGTIRPLEVVGVVKDFHFRSLHHKISPLMLVYTPPQLTASIKVRTSNISTVLKTIEEEWKKIYGDRLFTFNFLDEKYNRQYKVDEQLATIIIWFTGLALVVACLGLFALSSFMVSRRTKEIGIRKSMGASIKSIYILLSWDFLKWIFVAAVVACPVAWFLMQWWLSKFAYHIPLRASIFVIAAFLALCISLLTVTWQSLKAASANPIKALRYE